MRIVHLSDLHFGTETSDLVADLRGNILSNAPDMVIISGDFTQVATDDEFASARDFIKTLSVPVFCVPGNHDISRYNFIERITDPYRRYKKYIDEKLCPVFVNDQVVIAGINTARRALPHWNWANGAVSAQQLRHIESVFTQYPHHFKICVMHHPVHKVLENPLDTVVFGGGHALQLLKAMKTDLVLTGHVHHASITKVEAEDGHKTIFLSASTALSQRLRRQANGYNVITLDPDKLRLDIQSYKGRAFICQETFEQIRGGELKKTG